MADCGADSADAADLEGYVGDSLYPSVFHTAFGPAWIDRLRLREGIAPPRRSAADSRFTLMDLGCGDALGLIIHAAAHPESRFIGIDAMPAHIERGRAMAAELGVDNVELRLATFDEALRHPSAGADYIVAQGVLSWVRPCIRRDLLALTAHNLRDGGVAAIGYNCMPGWRDRLSFQKLLYLVSKSKPGSPTDRYELAYDHLRSLSKGGMASLGDRHFEWIDRLREQLPREYFPHEYLSAFWEPLWAADVIGDAQTQGLRFLRSNMSNRLREDFILKSAQREALATLETLPQREVATDLYINCQFRIDLYIKEPVEWIDEATTRAWQLSSWWLLKKPADQIEYSLKTPAGTLRFDNVAARALVERLDRGPAALSEIAEASDAFTHADLLNVSDALFTAGVTVPVDPPDGAIETARINDWLADQIGSTPTINALVTPYGPVDTGAVEIRAILGDSVWGSRLGLG